MGKVKNPCYSPETGNCPDRKAGCSATCEKWRKHKEARNKIYEERAKEFKKLDDYISTRKTRWKDKYNGGY